MAAPAFDDDRFERLLGTLLRVGVVIAATVVMIGGGVYLVRHAREPVDYSKFEEDRDLSLRTPAHILDSALELRGRGIVQLGLLLLIATPVARVVFSVFGFARQRDWIYVAMTLVVLGVLMYSLFLES
jgi:uncharacterized membrane protein